MQDPPADPRVSPAQSPRRVSHYEILDEIGRGGMGLVYRALDVDLGRQVALKCPWPELASEPGHRHRFLREARAASLLSHPNIVPVFEVFEHAGTPWLAMELVEGPNLRTLLSQRGALRVDEIIRHAESLASALWAAHARRILHRDVNPKNILISPDGRARLTDFGLAGRFVPPGEESSASTASGHETTPGTVLGTPGYMSPEQALGKPVDPRSDLFSLGAVLYEMATGEPAFVESEKGALIDAVLHQEPRSISRLNYGVPPELERIVRKLLAKEPEERYQDARELIADLRALRRRLDSSVALREAALPRRRFFFGLSLLTAALTTGAVVSLWWLARRGEGPTALPQMVPRQITSAPGWEDEPALSPDGSLVAFSSNESGNADVWLADSRGGSLLRLTDSPSSDRSPAWLPDGSAILFVSDRTGRDAIWKVPRLGGSATMVLADGIDPAVSPDGKTLAFARSAPSGDPRIAVASIDRPSDVRILTSDSDGLWEHRHPAWSPDGRSLCYSAFKDLWIVPLDEGKARRLTVDGETDSRPAWSPDGRVVYFASSREGTLALWRVSSRGGRPERLTMGTGPEAEPSLSSDGRRLAYSTRNRSPDLVLVDRTTGVRTRLPGDRIDDAPALSPDGRSVVFVSDRWAGRPDLWLQPLREGKPEGGPRRLTDHPGSAEHPTFSPDGRWIAYFRVNGEERDIWTLPIAGGEPIRFTDDPAADLHPAWSPRGDMIAFASERGGGTHLWVAPVAEGRPSGPARQITRGETTDLAPAWSPDGSRLAYVAIAGTAADAWVVPLDGSEPPTRITSGSGALRVRWDPTLEALLVVGTWGSPMTQLKMAPLRGGASIGTPLDIVVGEPDGYFDFDVSKDGRFFVISQEDPKGDIWILESQNGSL